MYDEKQLQRLVNMALDNGADLVITHDAKAKTEEGRTCIETIRVRSGIRGIGPAPMSAFYACERLREAKADGLLGPVIVSVTTSPPRRRTTDPSPSLIAQLSSGEVRTLFKFDPDGINFEKHEFIGLTHYEAIALKSRKDVEWLHSQEESHSHRERP